MSLTPPPSVDPLPPEVERELEVMADIVRIMQPLDQRARLRVLRFVADRFDLWDLVDRIDRAQRELRT